MHLINPPTRALVRAALCPSWLLVGDAVMVTGPKVGRSLTVSRFDPFSDLGFFRPAIGVCSIKPTATTCRVHLWGILPGVYTGLSPGHHYLLDATSRPALTAPALGGGGFVMVQQIGVATSTDELMISPCVPMRRS